MNVYIKTQAGVQEVNNSVEFVVAESLGKAWLIVEQHQAVPGSTVFDAECKERLLRLQED